MPRIPSPASAGCRPDRGQSPPSPALRGGVRRAPATRRACARAQRMRFPSWVAKRSAPAIASENLARARTRQRPCWAILGAAPLNGVAMWRRALATSLRRRPQPRVATGLAALHAPKLRVRVRARVLSGRSGRFRGHLTRRARGGNAKLRGPAPRPPQVWPKTPKAWSISSRSGGPPLPPGRKGPLKVCGTNQIGEMGNSERKQPYAQHLGCTDEGGAYCFFQHLCCFVLRDTAQLFRATSLIFWRAMLAYAPEMLDHATVASGWTRRLICEDTSGHGLMLGGGGRS